MNGICPNCQTIVEFYDALPFSRVECPECSAVFIVPEIFKNYQLVNIEEEFSIFKKHRGYDLSSDKEVFVTVLNKKFSGYRKCMNYCRSEIIGVFNALKHPGIVPILEYGEHDGAFYFTEPCSVCFKLSEYDSQVLGEFDAASVFNIFKTIAGILKSAHDKDFVHHNICSNNILIDSEGNVKLQNFLISRVLYKYESENNIRSSVSPFLVSPEKAESDIEQKGGDIFSLGVILYYVLTGKYPFDGESDDEIIKSRIKSKGLAAVNSLYKVPPAIDTFRDDIAMEYSELIAHMLRPSSVQRPKIGKFIDRLNSIEIELEKQHSRNFNESFANIISFDNEVADDKSELKGALDRNELILYYQPIINLKSNTVSGFEALLRWPKSPTGNGLPGSFIPKINSLDVVNELGLWVVDNACRQLSEWNNGGYDDLYMVINISPEQIKDVKFKEVFGGIVKKYNLSNNQIIPEVSRISSYDKTDLTVECYESFLTFFNSRISLDEITSKYKALQRKFGKLRIHSLIIDSDYLINLNNSEEIFTKFKSIIAFANSASVKTVVEKIETREQADFVKDIGCSLAQGFYFYKPMPAADATKLLEEN